MESDLAVSPDTNEAFLREVDEELRRDQALNFWRQYGRLAVGAVVAALLIFGAVLFWRNHREQVAAEQSQQLSDVFDKLAANKTAEADAAIKKIADSDIGAYRALAQFLQADLLIRDLSDRDPAKKASNLKAAAAKFAAVAQDSSIPQPLRDLALVRQTSAEFDTLPPQQIVDRLKPLAVKGGPWLPSAGEMSAIALLDMNKPAEARTVLKLITDDQAAPDSIRQRAVQLLGSIDADSSAKAGPVTSEKKS